MLLTRKAGLNSYQLFKLLLIGAYELFGIIFWQTSATKNRIHLHSQLDSNCVVTLLFGYNINFKKQIELSKAAFFRRELNG